jgi:hypothetical protein
MAMLVITRGYYLWSLGNGLTEPNPQLKAIPFFFSFIRSIAHVRENFVEFRRLRS